MKRTLKKIGFIVLAVCMLAALFTVSASAETEYSGFNGHLNVKALCDSCQITINDKTYNITAYVDRTTLKVTANGTKFDFNSNGYTTGEVSALAEHAYRNANLPDGLDVNSFYVECEVILDAGQVSLYGLDFVLEKREDGLVHIPYAGYYGGANECTNGFGLRSRHNAYPLTCPSNLITHNGYCTCPITGYDLYLKVSKNLDPKPETKYTLTYDANGGEGAPEAVTGLAAQKDYVLAETPVPTHADVNGKKVEFIGWTAEKTDKIYANNETAPATIKTVDIEGDTTVYAAWKYAKDGEIVPDPDPEPETEYTLTFETNGGTKVDSVKAKSGTVIDLGKYTTAKDGYKFVGWFADAELTEAVDSVTLKQDTTVYAKWEKIDNDDKKDDDKKDDDKKDDDKKDDDNKKDDSKKDDSKKDDKKTPSTGDTVALLLGSVLAAVTAAGTIIIYTKRKRSGAN